MIVLFYICYVLAFIPLILIYPIRTHGKKNLKELKGKNYILACNHMSNYDAVFLDFKLAKRVHYLSKKQLFSTKTKAFWMRVLGGHPVDAEHFNPSSIKEILRLIEKKKIVGIFPQGRRCATPFIEDGAAKEGVAMFALRTGTPVVPMAYSRKIRPFRRVKLYIGKPIYPDAERKKDKEYQTEFSNLVVDSINKLLEGDKK